MSVTPRGMGVQEAYREYRKGNFRVNRRYQRKLVWTIEEKRALVESILCGYPIPLILLAYETHSDGSRSFEILDGMQRLNAVFSYVENAFEVNGKYFDVSQLARARQLSDQGVFSRQTDQESLLAAEDCANFLDYTLAVTEFPANDEAAVNEVFRRINSYGRQLSPQERRQAGVITPFASLVRELAAEIRGDVSKDSLDLADMPEISVDIEADEDHTGIQADDTFWCKHGILRRKQLRASEDEQMLTDLAITILEEKPFPFSGKLLDAYYDPDSEEAQQLDRLLASYGATQLKHDIQATISVMRTTVEYSETAHSFRRVVNPKGGANPVKTAFYAVFNAFYDLCVKQKKSPAHPEKVMEALTDLQSKLNIAAGQIRSEPRLENIRLTKGLIQDYFQDKEPPAIIHSAGASIAFENALRRSRVETAAYECKQGLLRLDNSRTEDTNLLSRIVETLCGIANIGPDSEGALFVGVADKESDMKRVAELDGVEPRHVGARFCVGIDRELPHLGIDLEAYKRRVVDSISSSALSSSLKSDVLARVDCISYRGLSVLCLWVPSQAQASDVGEELFYRKGSSTEKATDLARIKAILGRFGQA